MRGIRITALISSAFLSTAVFAQDGDDVEEIFYENAELATGEIEPFEDIDYDADGFLQWQEIRNMVTRLFIDADTDGDEQLSPEEFNFSEDHWEFSDRNKDGRVDLREMISHASQIFAAADLNNDEKLSPAEGEAAKKREGLHN